MQKYSNDPENVPRLVRAYMNEWDFLGASATPREIVEEQRETLFKGIHLHTVKELLAIANEKGYI